MNPQTHMVVADVRKERASQDEQWGEEDHPDGTGTLVWQREAGLVRRRTEQRFADGRGTWLDILAEEVTEAFAESDPYKLREELVQAAAVAVGWIEAIDRRLG